MATEETTKTTTHKRGSKAAKRTETAVKASKTTKAAKSEKTAIKKAKSSTRSRGNGGSRNGGSRGSRGGNGSNRRPSHSAPQSTAPQQDEVLIAPPKYRKGSMRIVPLGGLGEIGRNMNVVEYNGHILLIDCGVLFPEEEQPGVDLILPDFHYIKDRLDKVEALVLTHGHEDHIGGVPYLLKLRPDIPLIGSKLTLAFVEAKCKEHRINPTLVEVKGRDKLKVGPFNLEFVNVTHSIPDALAVFVQTPPARLSTPATSSSTSCRSTTASPIWWNSASSAKRAWTS